MTGDIHCFEDWWYLNWERDNGDKCIRRFHSQAGAEIWARQNGIDVQKVAS